MAKRMFLEKVWFVRPLVWGRMLDFMSRSAKTTYLLMNRWLASHELREEHVIHILRTGRSDRLRGFASSRALTRKREGERVLVEGDQKRIR
jgi:hypothetical protein